MNLPTCGCCDNTNIAMPNADAIRKKEKVKKHESLAHAYSAAVKGYHYYPDLMKLENFKRFSVDWFSVSYNKQGFLEVVYVVFEDQSAIDKYEGIDMTWMAS
jgi:hypothetical protein